MNRTPKANQPDTLLGMPELQKTVGIGMLQLSRLPANKAIRFEHVTKERKPEVLDGIQECSEILGFPVYTMSRRDTLFVRRWRSRKALASGTDTLEPISNLTSLDFSGETNA